MELGHEGFSMFVSVEMLCGERQILRSTWAIYGQQLIQGTLIHTCIPSTERLKQKDCHEFKTSLAA